MLLILIVHTCTPVASADDKEHSNLVSSGFSVYNPSIPWKKGFPAE